MPKSRNAKPPAHVTVKMVAEQAGVSIGAVSSVLNNRHLERRISLATVEKVRGVAARLGYLPNLGARRLRSSAGIKNSLVLAFVTSFEAPLGLVGDLIYQLRQSVAAGSGQSGRSFSVVIEMFSAGHLAEMPGLLTRDHFNAAIIANTTADDDVFLHRTHLSYPVVLVNRAIPGYSCVVEDPKCGGQAAELLAGGKHRRLAVMHGMPLTQSTRARVESFMTTVTRLIGRPAVEIVADRLSETAAYESMTRFLRRKEPIDALYCATDSMAVGAYHAIKSKQLRIPEDIAIIGVGDYEIAPFFDPPLSVVSVSRQQLGAEASRLLLRQLGPNPGLPSTVEIPVQAMLRASTGHQ